MAARQHLSIDLDADVAAILRVRAPETHLSEGEIVDRAVRADDLRALLAQIRERSNLDEDQALALARLVALATDSHEDALVTDEDDLLAIGPNELATEVLTPRRLVDRLG